MQPDNLNICSVCYYFEGNCLPSCPVGPYAANSKNVCVLCHMVSPPLVNQSNSCQATCDPNYTPLNGVCVLCKDNGLFNQGGVCQASCDAGFIADTNNICVPCLMDGATCVLVCPSGKTPDGSNVCVNCITMSLVELNGECVASCGFGMEPDGSGICITCQSNGNFVDTLTGNCVNPCPVNYIDDSLGFCQQCYFQSGLCVKVCNPGFNPNALRVCQSCYSQGLFDQNGICKTSCDSGYDIIPANNDNICYTCNIIF